MPLSKDELLTKLKDAGVSFEMFEHPPVMTVEAQVNALPAGAGTVLKNLFVKDKKHRCYIITALPDTKVDMQVLSARLGTGKGGLRLAPEELLGAVLQVPLGSVTPLAAANPEAAPVVLLLDAKVRDTPRVVVHPLVNTASLAMEPAALEAALRALGREPLYVDLEAEPKIDRDNPPDLKALADAATPPPAALPEAPGAGTAAAPAAGTAAGPAPAAAAAPKAAAPAKDAKKGGKAAADQKSKKGAPSSATALTDVGPRVEELLAMAMATLLGPEAAAQAAAGDGAAGAGAANGYALARLRADMAMQLTGLKNAAYAAGYTAGKKEVVAHAERRYA